MQWLCGQKRKDSFEGVRGEKGERGVVCFERGHVFVCEESGWG